MRFSKIFLLFLLTLFGSCVFAQDWIYTPNSKTDVYIDSDSIIKNSKGVFYIVKYKDVSLNKNLYALVMSTGENSAAIVKSYTEDNYKKVKNWESEISNSKAKNIKTLTEESPLYSANSLARIMAVENYENDKGLRNDSGYQANDTANEVDFGPYMKELQRRIKMNWDPPQGYESKRVVLLFKIAKNGGLLSCSVYKSSGLQEADVAAINAVKLATPFDPLPAGFNGSSIDIQFTFDYNVYNGTTKY